MPGPRPRGGEVVSPKQTGVAASCLRKGLVKILDQKVTSNQLQNDFACGHSTKQWRGVSRTDRAEREQQGQSTVLISFM